MQLSDDLKSRIYKLFHLNSRDTDCRATQVMSTKVMEEQCDVQEIVEIKLDSGDIF